MKITSKEAMAVQGPTGGVKPGKSCELTTGLPRPRPIETGDWRPGMGKGKALPSTLRLFFQPSAKVRLLMKFRQGQTIFGQGDTADAIFVILEGRVRLTARSRSGKEATLDLLSDQDFVGKDCIAGEQVRTASATARTDCELLGIEKKVMVPALAREVSLSSLLSAYVLGRNMRYQQDLVDQRRNPSEKRSARLLLLAHFDGKTSGDALVANVSHETLAEMVGTTQSRVCSFMKRFKESGFIDYQGSKNPMRICRSLCWLSRLKDPDCRIGCLARQIPCFWPTGTDCRNRILARGPPPTRLFVPQRLNWVQA